MYSASLRLSRPPQKNTDHQANRIHIRIATSAQPKRTVRLKRFVLSATMEQLVVQWRVARFQLYYQPITRTTTARQLHHGLDLPGIRRVDPSSLRPLRIRRVEILTAVRRDPGRVHSIVSDETYTILPSSIVRPLTLQRSTAMLIYRGPYGAAMERSCTASTPTGVRRMRADRQTDRPTDCTRARHGAKAGWSVGRSVGRTTSYTALRLQRGFVLSDTKCSHLSHIGYWLGQSIRRTSVPAKGIARIVSGRQAERQPANLGFPVAGLLDWAVSGREESRPRNDHAWSSVYSVLCVILDRLCCYSTSDFFFALARRSIRVWRHSRPVYSIHACTPGWSAQR